MTTISAADARRHFHRLLANVATTHAPIHIRGRRGDAVLVSADDWRGIQETLHLISIPGMRESIVEGMRTPIAECTEHFDG